MANTPSCSPVTRGIAAIFAVSGVVRVFEMCQGDLLLLARRKCGGFEGVVEPRAQRAVLPRDSSFFGMAGFGVEHVLAQEQHLTFRGIDIENEPFDWLGRFGCLGVCVKSHDIALVDAFSLKNGSKRSILFVFII